MLVDSSAAAEEAQVLGGVRREAAAGFVDEEANESLALVDRVAVVALVRTYLCAGTKPVPVEWSYLPSQRRPRWRVPSTRCLRRSSAYPGSLLFPGD